MKYLKLNEQFNNDSVIKKIWKIDLDTFLYDLCSIIESKNCLFRGMDFGFSDSKSLEFIDLDMDDDYFKPNFKSISFHVDNDFKVIKKEEIKIYKNTLFDIYINDPNFGPNSVEYEGNVPKSIVDIWTELKKVANLNFDYPVFGIYNRKFVFIINVII